MQLSGSFSELPWTEMLHFLAHSQVTGCLSLYPKSSYHQPIYTSRYHLWMAQGYFVSASSNMNGYGLLRLIQQQGWLSLNSGERLAKTLPKAMALGDYLTVQRVLSDRQRYILFQLQVIRRLNEIRHLKTALFTFQTIEQLPQLEMTGLRVPIYEIQTSAVYIAA
ncbi:MAG: hypothetical protein F6K42_21775 [Leptolyngbya sp. SIO1D8]|nr:hypothetical protein [Leptolyngbya sp. SIO1D8]